MAFPILAGLAMGALMGGGIAALQKKDILQGALMGGVGGALGGAFMPGIAGAAGSTASGSLGSLGTTTAGAANLFGAAGGAGGATGAVGGAGVGSSIMAGAPGAAPGILVNGSPLMTQMVASGAPTVAPAAAAGTGSSMFGGLGNFLTQNKGALLGGVGGGMLASNKEPKPAEQGNIYTTQFSQDQNPNFGAPGESYFSKQAYAPGTFTRVEDYKPTQMAANGGIVALADGGQPGLEIQRYSQPVRQMAPEVAAYNQQMMARANQQYNVNPRPGPMQVTGFDAPAPSVNAKQDAPVPTGPKDYIDDYYQQMLGRNADPTGRGLIEAAIKNDRGYDPARDIADVIRKSEEFKQSGKNPNPTGIEIGKVYSAGAPAAANSPSGLRFNPRTQQYEGTFAAPGDKKKTEIDPATGAGQLNNSSWASGDSGDANGGLMRGYNMGGLSSLGAYSDGGQLLKGPGDGVSDDIPARIGARQPARLADGEFVVPARIVSELGNGSTDAGAKQLYAMMDRVQKNRNKTVGKGKVAVDSKSRKLLPA
jgi:hypothetical protein